VVKLDEYPTPVLRRAAEEIYPKIPSHKMLLVRLAEETYPTVPNPRTVD
jgi:hypothetical protein